MGLRLQQVDQNTKGNYIQSNTADNQLELNATKKRQVSVVNDVDWTTGVETDVNSNLYKALRCRYIELTGAQAANRVLTLPDDEKEYKVKNSCTGGHSTQVKNASGTGIAMANGDIKTLFCNGTDIEDLT